MDSRAIFRVHVGSCIATTLRGPQFGETVTWRKSSGGHFTASNALHGHIGQHAEASGKRLTDSKYRVLRLDETWQGQGLLYRTILYYTILYYTILYYTILYYTILYYTILYYTILYYTILYYTILYYTILYYTILYYTILYYTILYYTILYYTILYYTILYYLYYTILYYTILYYTILYYTILYYTILYYTILYYTILYYTILYYTILYYTILYYTILYYTILYYTILYYTILSEIAPSAPYLQDNEKFGKPSEQSSKKMKPSGAVSCRSAESCTSWTDRAKKKMTLLTCRHCTLLLDFRLLSTQLRCEHIWMSRVAAFG